MNDQIQFSFMTSLNRSSVSSRFSASASTICRLLLFLIAISKFTASKDITDNSCTFKINGKLFTLVYLNQNKQGSLGYYKVLYNASTSVFFNFCDPFVPNQCINASTPSAYSYVVKKNATAGTTECLPFTSDSKTSYFTPNYINNKGQIQLNLTMETAFPNSQSQQTTTFLLDCEPDDDSNLTSIHINSLSSNRLQIFGQSPEACPVFQLSSLWVALSDNKFIFGIILLCVGFVMLFYGILMTHLMIFLTSYFLSFAILASIFTAFLTPNSSRIVIYFSLLLILFLSTLIAYGLTRLVNVSIFFIGAFFGFVVAALVNSIFCKIFDVYSVWSLVFFQIILTIPFGLLTFKYSQQIIILSTSLTGSYMIVRPFSWIFGGFPNEFTLYETFENGQLKTLPWTFFIYLIIILGVFGLGALYQLSKLQKKNPNSTQVSYLPEGLQNQLDSIHDHVDKLINKYHPQQPQQNAQYQKMNELSPINQIHSADGKQQNNEIAPSAKDPKKQQDF